MPVPDLPRQIAEQVEKLSPEDQRRVLDFIRTLAPSAMPGSAGKEWLRYAGTIPVEDLETMERAIEDGCERIDADEW